MKKYFIYSITLAIVFSLALSCSPTKNTFVSRNINALSTKFNVLYNGNIALEKGLKEIEETYNDNFYERIPIEPLLIKEETLRPRFNLNATKKFKYFELAEEKAVKAVQTHSINIRGVEHNPQIDDAYLLLGKTRYYTQRFVPALDAFNHTIKENSKANLIFETRIWQGKTQVRLQNEIYAIDGLNKMIRYNDLPQNIVADAHTVIAMAFNQIDSVEQVVKHLKLATEIALNPIQNARNLFVLGQIYREQQFLDSSNTVFNKLMNLKKAPYKFRIQAQIEIAKNYQASDTTNADILLETLQKLAENYDNKPYLDAIYYQMGIVETKNTNLDKATGYFNLSLKAPKTNAYQKLLNYEQLGIINFINKKYVTSGAYYDSVINTAKDKTVRKIRQIIRQRKKLDDVIYYNAIANTNDSILRVSALDSAAQITLFNTHIDYLKKREKDSIAQEQLKIQQQILDQQNAITSSKTSGGSFYFYNSQLTGFGKQEFFKLWGNRKLSDNWRYSDQSDFNVTTKTEKKDSVATVTTLKYNLDYYLNRLPKSAKQVDSIAKQRNDAYYQLGLIYKEQFKDYTLASERLETLLTFEPNKNLIIPVHYHLYKIYSLTDSIKAADEKAFITENYPKSHYAQIINNPNSALSFTDKNAPETKYKSLYNKYKSDSLIVADSLITIALKTYQGLPIIPKLKLLQAYTIIKLDGLKKFDSLIKVIALEYPNTVEGKKAKKTRNLIKKDLAEADNFTTPKDKGWYLAFRIKKNADVSKLENSLRTIIYEEEFSQLSMVKKQYDRTTKLFLIKGFSSRYSSEDFVKFLHKKYKNTLPNEFFVISQPIYNKVQQHKNLDVYLKSIK
ncbi:MAG: hypothetical protein L3J45_07240 [Flavobacteriaceae bacterium]|nr:hypothetical protein [Flavobacteriaceae bacterium]